MTFNITFKKIDESKNMKRFYTLSPVSNTFVDDLCAVTVRYGRIGTTGRTLTKLLSDQKSAWRYYNLCFAKRINHGYTSSFDSES